MFNKILKNSFYALTGFALAIQIFIAFAKANFVFELFTHYAVYYAIIWGLLGMFCAIKNWPYQTMVFLIASSINFAEISPYFVTKEISPEQSQITILSDNFYYKNQNVDSFLAILKEENPDVFVVHEASNIWANELNELSKDYPYIYLTKETGIHGILIGSRLEGTFTELPLGQKFGLELTLKESQTKILGVHPEAPVSKKFAQNRNNQFEDISAYIQNQKGSKVIVIGDFNCTPWSPYFKDLLNSGLKDAQLGFGLTRTWHSGFHPLKIQIDHALVTDLVTVDSFKILSKVEGADHLPIEVAIH